MKRYTLSMAIAIVALLISSSPLFGEQIHDTVASGDLKKVKELLKANPELVSSKDKDGVTPLQVAAAYGRKDMAEFLLANNADVNARAYNGTTPLIVAESNKHKEMAEWLLVHGAKNLLADIDDLPPSVVKTVPQSGELNVDPDMEQIAVTFSKDMKDGAWAWCQTPIASYPRIEGKPKYLQNKRTCTVKVVLEPDKTYVIWLNMNQFQGFQDRAGRPSVPYLLVFKTGHSK